MKGHSFILRHSRAPALFATNVREDRSNLFKYNKFAWTVLDLSVSRPFEAEASNVYRTFFSSLSLSLSLFLSLFSRLEESEFIFSCYRPDVISKISWTSKRSYIIY